jgi:predicted NUDIX family NTP pyrophosphohydrolase
MERSKTSAGLLMFRRRSGNLEVLLVHPGGPYFKNKDDCAWTIPKGEASGGEDLLTRARIEFEEEIGVEPPGSGWIELGTVKQKGGKTVHAWAFEGDLPQDFVLTSDSFAMEWPPRSGRTQNFPEIDRAEFFRIELAKEKINPAQAAFLDRLVGRCALQGGKRQTGSER